MIGFGENLPEDELKRSFDEAAKADLCLAMGSSLTVTPAADIPKDVSKKGKLVIVNLQSTPLDNCAFMRINALCQDVMVRLAKKMELKINEFIWKRMVKFQINASKELEFRGVDQRGAPFSFFRKVELRGINGQKDEKEELKEEPYVVDAKVKSGELAIEFYSYLGQPELYINIGSIKEGVLRLDYDPKVGKWVHREWTNTEKYSK